MRYPIGYPVPGKTKIAIAFPTALFEDMLKRAKKENKTFGDMVVELCSIGKFDLEESEQHEPAE